MTEPKLGGSRRGNAGKGRKPGSKNKTTSSVKEALLAAYQGTGGLTALMAWAKENPTEFYKLWGKLLPQDISHSGTVTLEQLLAASYTAPRAD